MSLFDFADKAAKAVAKGAADAAGSLSNAVADAGKEASKAVEAGAAIATEAGGKAVEVISNGAGAVVEAGGKTIEAITNGFDDYKNKQNERQQQLIEEIGAVRMRAINELDSPSTISAFEALGDSPILLTAQACDQIKSSFPVPVEQTVLWADAEFDLRPSGIIATNKGIFIKSDAVIFKLPFSQVDEDNTTSSLTFIAWEFFEPQCFTLDDSSNRALSVDKACSTRFIETCKSLSAAEPENLVDYEVKIAENESPYKNEPAISAAAGAMSSEKAIFSEQRAAINNPGGHGEMAEEANNILDNFTGKQAKICGRDNAKNGADRKVNGQFIQTKYYNSARGTLESAFDSKTGLYRYIDKATDNVMQLEVPKDQYERVIELFKKKIEQGKVPGVTNPAEAEKIVRKGWLTHKQAVNLTKPGKIESLAYDAATGAVMCSCAFGLSFVAAAFSAYRSTSDIEKSIDAGLAAGIQVFGTAFVQHILVAQFSRTSMAKALTAPSQALVNKLGPKASQTLVNSLRSLSGKNAIHGAAATNQLAKLLRSNAITSAITLAVCSIPETYNLVNCKISNAQYAKNMAGISGSVAGAAAGTFATGLAVSKVAGTAGTLAVPGLGTALGVAGGFVGGVVGATTVNAVSDVLYEGDATTIGRLLNAYISCLALEYLLDSTEVDLLVDEMNSIESEQFKSFFEDFLQSTSQENTIRSFLTPYFENVISNRQRFILPDTSEIEQNLDALLVRCISPDQTA